MSILDRIHKITRIPEIGEKFLVPCYPLKILFPKTKKRIRGEYVQEWLCPVLLPAHEDKKLLNFPIWHYHIDFRFFNDNAINFYYNSQLSPSRFDWSSKSLESKIHELEQSIRIIRTKNNKPDFESIVWRKIILRRYWNMRASLESLEKRFQDKKINCLTCRHKGVNLADQPVVDGIVTCPAHGLKWNVEHLVEK